MDATAKTSLRAELIARGFDESLNSPQGTMGFDDNYLLGMELSGLLEMLVARREKIFGSVGVVGLDAAKASYDDVVIAIEATKSTLDRLCAGQQGAGAAVDNAGG